MCFSVFIWSINSTNIGSTYTGNHTYDLHYDHPMQYSIIFGRYECSYNILHELNKNKDFLCMEFIN